MHPREGILLLHPFTALERISMTGNPRCAPPRWLRQQGQVSAPAARRGCERGMPCPAPAAPTCHAPPWAVAACRPPCIPPLPPPPRRSETCKLDVLAGLPRLRDVCASGYGEYAAEGLPPSVRHLSLQVRGGLLGGLTHQRTPAPRSRSLLPWMPNSCSPGIRRLAGHLLTHPLTHAPAPAPQWAVLSATSFQTISFVVPEGCQLASLALCSQRPLCLAAPSLARCASLQASARRVYLGLPLRRGAPWADVDELAARWAQVRRSWRQLGAL